MLHSPTTVGLLGHPLSFQQITMKEPFKPLQVSPYTRMHFCYVEKRVFWVSPKEHVRKRGKKKKEILLIVELLIWQRGTYSSNKAAFQKNTKIN